MGSEDEDEDDDGGALDWGASAAADAASLSPPPAPVVVAAAAPPGPPTSTSASTELLEPAGPSVCAEAAFQFVDEPLAGREFKGVSRAGALAAEWLTHGAPAGIARSSAADAIFPKATDEGIDEDLGEALARDEADFQN